MSERPSLCDRVALRALAEAAKDERWWLWDDPRSPGTGPTLSFAHAATPATVLGLLDELDRLRGVEEAAAELADQPFGSLNERSFYRLRESLDA